jgi:hypothetical protein
MYLVEIVLLVVAVVVLVLGYQRNNRNLLLLGAVLLFLAGSVNDLVRGFIEGVLAAHPLGG